MASRTVVIDGDGCLVVHSFSVWERLFWDLLCCIFFLSENLYHPLCPLSGFPLVRRIHIM